MGKQMKFVTIKASGHFPNFTTSTNSSLLVPTPHLLSTMKTLVSVLLLVAVSIAHPHHHQYNSAPAPVAAPALLYSSQYHAQDSLGSYKFGYSSSDGQEKEEARDYDGKVEGKFSYTDPEGEDIELEYEAGKDGFKARGDHLPQVPEQPDFLKKAYKEAEERLEKAKAQATVPTFGGFKSYSATSSFIPAPKVTSTYTATSTYTRPKETTFIKPEVTYQRPETTYVAPDATKFTGPKQTTYVRTETQTYVRPETQTYVRPETQTYVRPETQTYVRPETQSYVRPETQIYITPVAPTYVKPETQTYVRPETQTYVRQETQTYLRPEVQTYVRPETQIYVRPDTQTYARPEIQTYVKPETQTYVKPETHTYVRQDTQTYVRPEPTSYIRQEPSFIRAPVFTSHTEVRPSTTYVHAPGVTYTSGKSVDTQRSQEPVFISIPTTAPPTPAPTTKPVPEVQPAHYFPVIPVVPGVPVAPSVPVVPGYAGKSAGAYVYRY